MTMDTTTKTHTAYSIDLYWVSPGLWHAIGSAQIRRTQDCTVLLSARINADIEQTTYSRAEKEAIRRLDDQLARSVK